MTVSLIGDGFPGSGADRVETAGRAGALIEPVAAASGRPVSIAARDSSVRRAAVVVAPGATASALLKWTDVLNFPPAACRPVRAATLRVFAPDQFASRSAYFSLLACSKSGPIYLTISRIRAGLLVP